jgi:phosphatidylserine/phosphatidylglycerophosphate/cardiolipin synthase-like enzyme
VSAPLAAVVDEAARVLPRAGANALASALERLDHPAPERRWRVLAAVPAGHAQLQAARLFDAWQAHAPELSGASVALALRAACHTAASLRAGQTVEVVWTGPFSRHVPVRHTRAVLLEVIAAARAQLLLVSYAAFRVPEVLDALAVAAGRGVRIALVLETAEDSGGTLTVDGARAFSSVREHVAFYVWPAEQRPLLSGGPARLHAKAAVADDAMALVTSANLTGHAISANMELGLLVQGGPIPRRLRLHFTELIANRVLVPTP